MKKAKRSFTRGEATEIRALLSALRRADRATQKSIRHALRELGFYISEWPPRPAIGFTLTHFDKLVERGDIRIVG